MAMVKTYKAAQGRWREILTALGAELASLDGKHQPCPFCGGRDRYRFIDKDGSGSYFCNNCGPGLGMDFVMKLRAWDFLTAARTIDGLLGRQTLSTQPPQFSKKSTPDMQYLAIRRVLKAAKPVTPDCPAGLYLVARCGPLPAHLSDLRYHPGLCHSMEHRGLFPALLAIPRFADGRGASVLRTYLTKDGRKASVVPVRKIMPCPTIIGSAVRLGPIQERLGIAEGIETAICASKLFGLPVWSAVNAAGVASWVPPPGVRSVVVFADNDKNEKGQDAACVLESRLMALGLEVEIRIPPEPGTDWADVWAATKKEV